MDQALSLDVMPTERDLLCDAHPLRVPELLELVLFFVTENFEDRVSLRTCTLVNADWKAIAQPRLFTNTLLKVQRMPWHNREAMRALPSVLPLLRKLAISNTKCERDMTLTGNTQGHIVMKFSHQVTSTGFDVVAAWKPGVFRCTALVLTSCTFSSFAVLREVLAGLPDLVDLELNLGADSMECVDEEQMVADVPPGVALRTLKCLDQHNAMILDPLLRWMTTAESVCLEIVAIEIYNQAVLDALRALLHVGISTVRELEVIISPSGMLAKCKVTFRHGIHLADADSRLCCTALDLDSCAIATGASAPHHRLRRHA
jgi:hypothetical protein